MVKIYINVLKFNEKWHIFKLYLSVVLSKKESRDIHGNLERSPLNTAPPTYTISIADIACIFNLSESDFRCLKMQRKAFRELKKEDTFGSDLTAENMPLGDAEKASSDNNIPQEKPAVKANYP